MSDIAYLPLTSVLPEDIWPDELAASDDGSFLDSLACLIFDERADEEKYSAFVRAKVMVEARLALPLLEGTELVFGKGDTDETGLIDIDFTLAGREDGPPAVQLRIVTTTLSLSLSRDLLIPVSIAEVDGRLQVTQQPGQVGIPLPFALLVGFDGEKWSLDFEIPTAGPAAALDLPLCAIGSSGVIIEATGLELNFAGAGTRPAGAPAGWQGVYLGNAKVYVPDLFNGSFETDGLGIGTGGLSGRLIANFALDFDPNRSPRFEGDLVTRLFGMEGGLRAVEMRFTQSVPTAFALSGQILFPFFEAPVDVTIGLDGAGGFTAALSAPGGLLTLTKPGILEMTLESVAFQVEAGRGLVRISGSLRPLIGATADGAGLKWPEARVESLSIDSEGHVRIEGGWLSLRQQGHLDFYGFRMEITKLGFGSTDDGGRWIGFSGGLRFVDGLSAGTSVEGLRVTWYEDNREPTISLNGVGVEFAVPGTFSFRGFVSYSEPTPGNKRFDGKIRLVLTTLNLEIDGQLVIGRDTTAGFNYFAIFIGVELPVGIPLWSTGLGLYGMAGLFAYQMEPGKNVDEAWYGVGPDEGWYKRPQIGVANLLKWRDGAGALALGAGVTIGTVADNGFIFNGRFLLVLVFPGPILLIEGKANILKQRATLSEDPLLRSIAILDGRAGTFTVGLDAYYRFAKAGEVVEIGGGSELFFSFNDPSAWHLYLGVRDPRERRIRAEIFERLFEANAYFMLDPRQLALGAWVGYDKQLRFGPVLVTIEAWIEGNALVSFKPVHFHGELWLHGRLGAAVFGFGFEFGADARVSADVFDPFTIMIELSLHIGLPWPLPDSDIAVQLQWGPEKTPPPLPLPLQEVAIAHLKISTTWPLPHVPDYSNDGYLKAPVPDPATIEAAPPPDNPPTVPLDARPQITFGRTVHDDALVAGNPQPPSPEREWIGDPARNEGAAQVRFGLKGIRLQRWTGGAWETVASREQGVAPDPNPNRVLFGSWAPLPALGATTQPGLPPGVGQTKLWLWSRNPFDYTRSVTGTWNEWFLSQYPYYPCVPIPDDQEICCDLTFLQPGSALISPVFCPNHPEFSLGWDLTTRPVVDDLGQGQRALCFRQGDEVRLLLGRPVKAVRVFVIPGQGQQDAGGYDRRCADFTPRLPGRGANPLDENGFGFEIFDPRGVSVPNTDIRVVQGPIGSLGVLDLGWRGAIRLPFPSAMAELDLHISAAAPTATGFDARGAATVRATASGRGRQTLQLAVPAGGAPIVRVVVEAPQDETYLYSVCCLTEESPADAQGVLVFGLDRSGRDIGPFAVIDGTATLPGRDLGGVVVLGPAGFCVRGFCVTVGPDAADETRREAMVQRVREETERWSQTGFVLAPDTTYRLRIATTVEVSDWQYEDDVPFNSPVREQTHYAFFRTGGAPGLSRLSAPVGTPDPDALISGLEDLTRYVAETVPSAVPPAEAGLGDKAPLPRPVYRAYDVGVAFNEDYVDLLYRSSGRDLGLYLFDNNDQPARDAQARLLVATNRWGRSAELTLTETDRRWVAVVNASTCAAIDESRIARARTIGTQGQMLTADTLYEGRLVPLLLHETFLAMTVGASASGTDATLAGQGGGWVVRDDGNRAGPSLWIVGETQVEDEAVRWVEQRSSLWGGTVDPAEPSKPGTILLRSQNAALAPDHPDQPGNWTDYRFTAVLRSGDDDAIGLVFRYRAPSDYYVFSMDRQRRYRRLVRVQDGTWTELASDGIVYELNSDYTISVEAVGSRLRVLADSVLVFDVTDAAHSNGGIGLYSWDNTASRFSDVRVDDLRGNAAVVYRFRFTTSQFANFYHQILSGDGSVWNEGPLAAEAVAAISAALARGVALDAAPPGPPMEPETRAYADAVGAASARQDTPMLDLTRLVGPDGATIAVLLRTAEPINWARTTLVTLAASAQLPSLRIMPDMVPAGVARIVAWSAAPSPPAAAAPAEESVTLLLREPASPAGYRLEYRSLPGLRPSAESDGTVLANDDFTVAGEALATETPLFEPSLDSLEDFGAPVDAVGPFAILGNWLSSGGVIRQTALAGESSPLALAPGSLLPAGDVRWRDYRVQVRLRADIGAGAVGVLIRRNGGDAFYRFSLGFGPAGFRRLVRHSAGATVVLWEDGTTAAPARNYDLTFEAIGNLINVALDGAVLCSVRDMEPIPSGAIALYSWRCTGTVFSAIEVVGRTRRLGSWAVEDLGALSAAPAWQIRDEALDQTRDLLGEPDGDLDSFGSYAAWMGGPAAADYRVTVWLRLDSKPSVLGIAFRWYDTGNHYLLAFDGCDDSARLIRKVAQVGTLLWQGHATLVPGEYRSLTVEAVGSRLRAILDDLVLFDVYDAAHAEGGPALYSGLSGGSRFRQFVVEAAAPSWLPYYTFGAEPPFADGRRFRVFGGREEDVSVPRVPGEARRYLGNLPGDAAALKLPAEGVDLRLVRPDGVVVHAVRFASPAAFAALHSLGVRSSDGTGLLLFAPDAAAPAGTTFPRGHLSLRWTYLRDDTAANPRGQVLSQDGDGSPELVDLEVDV
jgi:hypothetical protein